MHGRPEENSILVSIESKGPGATTEIRTSKAGNRMAWRDELVLVLQSSSPLIGKIEISHKFTDSGQKATRIPFSSSYTRTYSCIALHEDKVSIDVLYSLYSGPDGNIPEEVVWRIFRCLVSELVPIVYYATSSRMDKTDQNQEEAWVNAPEYVIESPTTIWQIGKCIFQILTNGRFWSEEYNALNPIDNNEKFGEYKQNVLQKVYSRNLMKYVLACISAEPTRRY